MRTGAGHPDEVQRFFNRAKAVRTEEVKSGSSPKTDQNQDGRRNENQQPCGSRNRFVVLQEESKSPHRQEHPTDRAYYPRRRRFLLKFSKIFKLLFGEHGSACGREQRNLVAGFSEESSR